MNRFLICFFFLLLSFFLTFWIIDSRHSFISFLGMLKVFYFCCCFASFLKESYFLITIRFQQGTVGQRGTYRGVQNHRVFEVGMDHLGSWNPTAGYSHAVMGRGLVRKGRALFAAASAWCDTVGNEHHGQGVWISPQSCLSSSSSSQWAACHVRYKLELFSCEEVSSDMKSSHQD